MTIMRMIDRGRKHSVGADLGNDHDEDDRCVED